MTGHTAMSGKCGQSGCVECAMKERLAKRDAAAARKSLRTMADDALRIIGDMAVICANDASALRDLKMAAGSIAIVREHFEEVKS